MKRALILLTCIFLISCSSYKSLIYGSNEEVSKRLEKTFKQLDKRYYDLLDDEINENERKSLEKDYRNFYTDLIKSRFDRKINVTEYINKTKLRIDYLTDLE